MEKKEKTEGNKEKNLEKKNGLWSLLKLYPVQLTRLATQEMSVLTAGDYSNLPDCTSRSGAPCTTHIATYRQWVEWHRRWCAVVSITLSDININTNQAESFLKKNTPNDGGVGQNPKRTQANRRRVWGVENSQCSPNGINERSLSRHHPILGVLGIQHLKLISWMIASTDLYYDRKTQDRFRDYRAIVVCVIPLPRITATSSYRFPSTIHLIEAHLRQISVSNTWNFVLSTVRPVGFGY
jgi:hypothetical protein